jgi:hypothetical protein
MSKSGKFSSDSRPYAWEQVDKMNAMAWWEAWFSDFLLSKVVKTLDKVPLTSTATERNWSLRGAIHTKVRNRMKVSTASQITFIKHNSLIQHADMFKKAKQVLSSTSSYGSESVEDTEDIKMN